MARGDWSLAPPGEVHHVDSDSADYHSFRGSPSYEAVAAELREEARRVWELEGRRMFITRHTILGRMHQHKQTAWRARRAMALKSDHMPERDPDRDPWDLDYPKGSPKQKGDLF